MPIALLALSILSSCGGGSGTSSDTPPPSLATVPVSYVSPDNGAPVKCCAVEFALRNGRLSKYTGGVYRITLHDEQAGLTTLAASDTLTEDSAGEVHWAPPIALDENRAYWWKWSAVYAQENVASEIGVFYVMGKKSLMAISPRHTGWMDSNLAAQPSFVAFNAYTGEGVPVSYDFELYANASLSSMFSSISGLPQDIGRYTAWRPFSAESLRALNRGSTYYWRVRANFNGLTTAWAGLYSFTVQSPCDITGGKYASYAIDWIPRRQCKALLLTDPVAALGPPDAAMYPWRNFISLDCGGEVVLEMGATVIDRPGPDIRVYQVSPTSLSRRW